MDIVDAPAMGFSIVTFEALSPLLASVLPLSQLCTSPDELSQSHRSREHLHCVTTIRPHRASHHRDLRSSSRFQAVPIGNGWLVTTRIRFSSMSRVSLRSRIHSCRLLIFSVGLFNSAFPAVSVRKLHKLLLHVVILSCPPFQSSD